MTAPKPFYAGRHTVSPGNRYSGETLESRGYARLHPPAPVPCGVKVRWALLGVVVGLIIGSMFA